MSTNRTAARAEAAAQLERLTCFPGERDDLRELAAQLLDPEDVFARSNMRGHITCSAVVLNPEGSKVLRIHHKALGLWLPPGGHYEDGDSLWESARREVVQETGLLDAHLHPWSLRTGLPSTSTAIASQPTRPSGKANTGTTTSCSSPRGQKTLR